MNKIIWLGLFIGLIASSGCKTDLPIPCRLVLDNGRTDFKDYINWYFDWPDEVEATQYHLQVKRVGALNPVIDDSTITESFYEHKSISYIKEDYYCFWKWQVRSMINGKWGDWSISSCFCVETVNTDPEI